MNLKPFVTTLVLSAATLGIVLHSTWSRGQDGSGNGNPKIQNSIVPAAALKSGSYRVCDVGNHDAHGATVGRHLELGDSVIIGALDLATEVQLGRQVLSMIRIGDGEELRVTYDFAHAQKASKLSTNVTHLVRISRDDVYRPSPLSECKGTGDVLIVQFCPKVIDAAGKSEWECNPANADQGHVHAEN